MQFAAASSLLAQTIATTPHNGPTTISIHARTTDGNLPVDVNCTIGKMLGQQELITMSPPLSLVGKNGDWTAANVPPEVYEVVLRGSNYTQSVVQFLPVKSGFNYSIGFVLSRGATFKGRILDDATSKPIAEARVNGEPEHSASCHVRTDTEGRYEVSHITGALRIEVQTSNHVAQIISVDSAAEDSTITVPDIRLKHGGRIVGRVEHPAEVERNAIARVSLEIQGGLPANTAIEIAYARADGAFRTQPLPPGTYTLHAEWRNRGGKGGRRQTWKAKGSTTDIQVIVGQDTTNVLISTKLTNPANK